MSKAWGRADATVVRVTSMTDPASDYAELHNTILPGARECLGHNHLEK